MYNFIQAYLEDPSQAVSSALESLHKTNRFDDIDDDVICSQLSSPEFRLYENIIFSMPADDGRHAESMVRPAVL